MAASLHFYRDILGLKLERRFQAGADTEIAFLGEGETKIELICRASDTDVNIGDDISWAFTVDSVDDFMLYLKEQGVTVHSGPFQPNPHVRFFYVLDPNGMKIQLAETLN
jgi:lactoylglutathione lyase